MSWLLSLLLGAVRAVRALSGPAAVCAMGCIILALQTAMLLQQRQQLAHLHTHPAPFTAALPGLNDSAADGRAAQHAALIAGLGRDLAALHRAVQQLRDQSEAWRLQLDSLAAAAAGLAARLQQHAGAAG